MIGSLTAKNGTGKWFYEAFFNSKSPENTLLQPVQDSCVAEVQTKAFRRFFCRFYISNFIDSRRETLSKMSIMVVYYLFQIANYDNYDNCSKLNN